MERQVCGNCDDCARDGEDLICVNIDSEHVTDYVEECHTCDCWHGKIEE